MTKLEGEDILRREITAQVFEFSNGAGVAPRVLCVELTSSGLTVWGKGLQRSLTLPWRNVIQWASRTSGKRKNFWKKNPNRDAARNDAVRAIREQFPDRADQIIAALGI